MAGGPAILLTTGIGSALIARVAFRIVSTAVEFLPCRYVSTSSGWEVSFSWRYLPPIGFFQSLLIIRI